MGAYQMPMPVYPKKRDAAMKLASLTMGRLTNCPAMPSIRAETYEMMGV